MKRNPPPKTEQKDHDCGRGTQQRPPKYDVVQCLLQCTKQLSTGLGPVYLGKYRYSILRVPIEAQGSGI